MRGKTDEEILKERKVLIADVYMKTHEISIHALRGEGDKPPSS